MEAQAKAAQLNQPNQPNQPNKLRQPIKMRTIEHMLMFSTWKPHKKELEKLDVSNSDDLTSLANDLIRWAPPEGPHNSRKEVKMSWLKTKFEKVPDESCRGSGRKGKETLYRDSSSRMDKFEQLFLKEKREEHQDDEMLDVDHSPWHFMSVELPLTRVSHSPHMSMLAEPPLSHTDTLEYNKYKESPFRFTLPSQNQHSSCFSPFKE
ncbi:hypothetical protein Q3G72_024824 [Acer saccharum]|nr:hypothetical protein Q3G72_024824 [Acer saccharum]